MGSGEGSGEGSDPWEPLEDPPRTLKRLRKVGSSGVAKTAAGPPPSGHQPPAWGDGEEGGGVQRGAAGELGVGRGLVRERDGSAVAAWGNSGGGDGRPEAPERGPKLNPFLSKKRSEPVKVKLCSLDTFHSWSWRRGVSVWYAFRGWNDH